MKYFFPFLFLLILGCADDDLKGGEIDHEIIGQWQLEATKISPGGIVDWTRVDDGAIYDFQGDGSLELSKWDGCKAPVNGTFAIAEEKLYLRFFCNSELYEPVYRILVEEKKLILGFIGCIEECSYRFKRVD
ncbi:hypothetical protein HZY62_10785 [Maribacter polysiphoniae]|uniref:Lipocalin-like protein n=1 Tax=Maribacter polysiphoniae TaxID=429344 RepID=A0A316DZV0_9FLAO|nr:hypothetical protein [Maribacter polysiphoniae]MBD1261075.1 hypothetical protein [Maribacter polysiphoniae]PWK23684.1 hypothetical protein LX92_02251 [Maribacter polysiphoniae]